MGRKPCFLGRALDAAPAGWAGRHAQPQCAQKRALEIAAAGSHNILTMGLKHPCPAAALWGPAQSKVLTILVVAA